MDNVIATRPHKIIYREGNTCVKAFDEHFSKADILNEALNQARIEQTGLNIPKLLGVTTVDGKWAILSEFIEGKTLAHLMEEHPDKKDMYLAYLVD
ncbi:MAG: aminoglycoside phosphotransferase, partial [Faecousia sp.]